MPELPGNMLINFNGLRMKVAGRMVHCLYCFREECGAPNRETDSFIVKIKPLETSIWMLAAYTY
jgi:hypothetical protein